MERFSPPVGPGAERIAAEGLWRVGGSIPGTFDRKEME